MEYLSKRDELFNEILTCVKNAVAEKGFPIGVVRAVLNEVDGEIARAASYSDFDTIRERLRERTPRELYKTQKEAQEASQTRIQSLVKDKAQEETAT